MVKSATNALFLAHARPADLAALYVWVAAAVALATLALPLLSGGADAAPARRERADVGSGGAYLVRDPFPRWIAALALTYAAVGACVDYVFRVGAAARLDEVALASLFGD